MNDEIGHWASLLQWLIANPEKGALFLVLLAGAWRWIRDLRKEVKEDHHHESFTEMLMRENKELRDELKYERHKNDTKPKLK